MKVASDKKVSSGMRLTRVRLSVVLVKAGDTQACHGAAHNFTVVLKWQPRTKLHEPIFVS